MSRILNRILIAGVIISVLLIVLGPERPDYPERSSEILDSESEEILPTDKARSITSLRSLSSHFPDERVEEKQVEEDPVVEISGPSEPQFTSELKFISSVVKAGSKSWYFKESRTNRIYELSPDRGDSPWSWVAAEEDYFLLKKNETIYKVRK